MLDEFYRIAFRKKVYETIVDLQADLDLWMREFNEATPHQGKWCFGKTPMQTFLDALPSAMSARLIRPRATRFGEEVGSASRVGFVEQTERPRDRAASESRRDNRRLGGIGRLRRRNLGRTREQLRRAARGR
jgi:hypothetical protein